MSKRHIRLFIVFLSLAFLMNLVLEIWEKLKSFNYDYSLVDDDLNHDIQNLIRKYGYPFENHTVITTDGYILELHRIPHGISGYNTTFRKTIFIQHGIFASSAVWLLEGPTRALAYRLADAGYDVWLGNSRGNIYTRKHAWINVDENPKQFYNYTWHEIGYYDLAASIDYVRNITGQDQLDYACHSQGCVTFFVLMSERPEYNRHIRVMIAMAPIVFTQHAWNPAFVLGRMYPNHVAWMLKKLDVHILLPGNFLGSKAISTIICADASIFQPICRIITYFVGGYNPQQLNTTLLPLFFTFTPVGGSTMQVLHYIQISKEGKFCKYDYGEEENLLRYGRHQPPDYNFKNIMVPIVMFYSENDFYSSENDFLKLVQHLPNVIQVEKIEDQKFTHFNFMYSMNIYELLNSKIVNILLSL